MTIQKMIFDILEGDRLTIEDITKRINNKYEKNISENSVRVNINRLKNKDLIEKCGIDNRYKIYKLKIESTNNLDSKILKKMIPEFIKHQIEIELNENEIRRVKELHAEI